MSTTWPELRQQSRFMSSNAKQSTLCNTCPATPFLSPSRPKELRMSCLLYLCTCRLFSPWFFSHASTGFAHVPWLLLLSLLLLVTGSWACLRRDSTSIFSLAFSSNTSAIRLSRKEVAIGFSQAQDLSSVDGCTRTKSKSNTKTKPYQTNPTRKTYCTLASSLSFFI